MNALQRFLSMNCLDLLFYDKSSSFYGYWIPQNDNVLIDLDTINNFLYNIEPIEFVLDLLICYAAPMFLENFVTISSNDPISLDIINAKVKIKDTNSILIKNILNKINKSSNIELVFWYQYSVLTIIMKLVFSKIIQYLNEEKLPLPPIIIMIHTINSKISENNQKLPTYLVNGFFLLAKVNVPIKELVDYNNSLDNVILGKWESYSKNIESNIVLCEHKNTLNSMKITINSILVYTEVDSIHWDTSQYLNNIITNIFITLMILNVSIDLLNVYAVNMINTIYHL